MNRRRSIEGTRRKDERKGMAIPPRTEVIDAEISRNPIAFV
jgi:hypothetical protein